MFATKRLGLVAALLIAGLGAAGCSDDDSNPFTPTPTPRVMVVHASPDAPAVDILVDDAVVSSLAGMAYPNNSGYLVTSSGPHNYKLNVTGTATTVIDTTFDLVQGNSYTIVACDSASKIRALILWDDLVTPVLGKTHVRFGHFSPNAPAVDVAVQGGPVLFADQSFKEFTDFTALDAGTYDLEVRLAGQQNVVLSLTGITLESGKNYSIFARGFVGGAGGQELAAEIILND